MPKQTIRLNRITANVTNNSYLYTSGNTIQGAALVTSNVSEGTNLYFTNARVSATFTGKSIALSLIFGS